MLFFIWMRVITAIVLMNIRLKGTAMSTDFFNFKITAIRQNAGREHDRKYEEKYLRHRASITK